MLALLTGFPEFKLSLSVMDLLGVCSPCHCVWRAACWNVVEGPGERYAVWAPINRYGRYAWDCGVLKIEAEDVVDLIDMDWQSQTHLAPGFVVAEYIIL